MGALHRLRNYRMSPRGRTWLARGLALVGFALLLKVLLEHGADTASGGGGIDALAYWTAARHLIEGQPLYAVQVGAFTAYSYPPLVAQALVPAALLPDWLFIRLWQLLEIACLVIAVGWTRAGLALLIFPPVIAEIDAGNVHLIMAAACSLVMRGAAWTVGPTIVLKFASGALLPLAWVRDRRGLLLGVGVAAAGVIASVVLAPTHWLQYIDYVRESEFPTGWYNIAEQVPLPLRLAVAAGAAIAATRWMRLAPVAVLLAYPIVWFHGLSTLVAVVAPMGPARARAAAPAPEAGGAGTLASAASGSTA